MLSMKVIVSNNGFLRPQRGVTDANFGFNSPQRGSGSLIEEVLSQKHLLFCPYFWTASPRLASPRLGEGEGEGRCKLRVCDANARPRQCQFLDKGRVKPIIGKSTLVLLYTNIHLARTNPFSQI